jgi:hypothetical protein
MIDNYMRNVTKLPSKAWVSLLWSQYNRLSEPLKDGFINMAYSLAIETCGRDTDAKIHKRKSRAPQAEIGD